MIAAATTTRPTRDFDAALALDAERARGLAQQGDRCNVTAGQSSQAAARLIARRSSSRPSKPALAYYVRGLANEDSGNVKAAYADLQSAARDARAGLGRCPVEASWRDYRGARRSLTCRRLAAERLVRRHR